MYNKLFSFIIKYKINFIFSKKIKHFYNFIFFKRKDFYILNLNFFLLRFFSAMNVFNYIVINKEKILFLGFEEFFYIQNKKNFRNHFFITKWLSGFLTNNILSTTKYKFFKDSFSGGKPSLVIIFNKKNKFHSAISEAQKNKLPLILFSNDVFYRNVPFFVYCNVHNIYTQFFVIWFFIKCLNNNEN